MGSYQIIDILTYLSPVGLSLGIAVGCIKFRSLDTPHRLLIPYLLMALLTDILSRTIVPYYGKTNLILLPLFSLAEIGVFTLIYYHFFQHLKRLFVCILGSAITFVYIIVLYCLFSGSKLDLTSFTNVSSSVGIIVFSLLYFFDRLQNMKEINWQLFSLNGSILVYFAIKLIFYIPLYFFVSVSSDLKYYFWLLYLIITIVFYGLLIKALWKNGQIVS